MSRYNPHHDIDALLEAAQQWRDRCLLEDGSLFGDTSLWTAEHLDELNRAFIQNPIEGSDTFTDKLALQLADASPAAIQLMAELNWLLLLFSSNIKPDTKRGQIRQIWELSGTPFPDGSPFIVDRVLGGVGSTVLMAK